MVLVGLGASIFGNASTKMKVFYFGAHKSMNGNPGSMNGKPGSMNRSPGSMNGNPGSMNGALGHRFLATVPRK